MRDIPCFSCGDGVATLLLEQVAVSRRAFVVLRGVFTTTQQLLEACIGFCRAVGAQEVYASGEGDLSALPVYARLMEREAARQSLPQTPARACPTQEPDWLEHYRRSFAHVPAAKDFSSVPEGACFVCDGGARIGLGLLQHDTLAAVATLAPHRGTDCVCALAQRLGPRIRLQCAMENAPAMALYDRLGFTRGAIRETWHRVL